MRPLRYPPFALFILSLACTQLTLAYTRAVAETASNSPSGCGQRCVLVKTITVHEAMVPTTVVLTGSIAPRYQSNIAFRVGGRIGKRDVEVGDHVTAETVLATLDPRDQQSNVDAAKAMLASAQALLDQSKIAFARQQDLMKSGYTTRPSFDAAQQQLRTQDAAVESAKAALSTAQEQLGYTDLKAGAAGILIRRDAEQGQIVQAGQTVFVLAQDGARDAVFDVYEALLAEPPKDRRVAVALLADTSVATVGTVREISPTVDDKAGSVRVKICLDHVPKGMSLGAAVLGTGAFRPTRAMLVPRAALFRWDDRPALWIYDPATRMVAPQRVSIARYEGAELVVDGGLKPGDRVVTAGIQFLDPGKTVVVADANQPDESRKTAVPVVRDVAGGDDGAPPLLRPVVTTKVHAVTSQTFGPFAGTIEPRYQSQLGFQLAGRMVARDVYVGDLVKKGQRLAALDPTVTQFALLQAKANVLDAKAQLENAQGIEQRQKTLASGGVASQATLDNAIAGLATAKARLEQAKAGLDKAQDQLGYAELHATFDAVVSGWQAEVGQYIELGTTVVTLARPDVREAVVDIPDELTDRLTPGLAFEVTLQAAAGISVKAVIREIGPMADDSTRSHRVRMTLVDPSPAFRLGTTVKVARETTAAPTMPLPAGALLDASTKPYVYVLSNDARSVHRRDVVLDTIRDGIAHVARGLEPGEEVVTVGVNSLVDGEAVAGSIANLAAGATATESGAQR